MSIMTSTPNLIGFSSPIQVRWNERFTMALRKPLYERCYQLNSLLQEAIQTSNSESRLYYTNLIDEIFATNGASSGWGIKTACREANPSDYDCLLSFLKPENCFLNWIQYLMTDRNFKCELPLRYLKPSLQTVISSGVVPNFLGKRMNQAQSGLMLDPLEYFWFSFLIAIQSSSTKSQINYSSDSVNSLPVYIPLLESYLNFFLPLKSNVATTNTPDMNQSQSSLWHSLSSTTSNLLHLGSSDVVNSPRMSTPRSSLLNVQSIVDQGRMNANPSRSLNGSEYTVAENLLNILSELLLDTPDRQRVKKNRSPVNRASNFTPTQDHMRCVRVVIKHLHYFSNSAPGKDRLSDTQYRAVGSLDDLKRKVWSKNFGIQSRLYNLFRISFDLWPSDASLRLLLETWLSYIQPWRYLPGSQQDQSRGSEDSAQLTPVSDDWLPFITDNLLFYNVIFFQVIARFTCLDVSTSINALMLNRVTKVYAHPNLDRLIRQAENSLDSLNVMKINAHNRHSLFSPSRSPTAELDSLPSKHHLQESEDPNFEIVMMFSPKATEPVTEILREINLAKAVVADELKTVADATIPRVDDSFLGSLKSFFADNNVDWDMDKKCKELKRIETYLTTSEIRLREIFSEQIFGQEITNDPNIISAKIRQRHLSSPSSVNKKPDIQFDQFGTPRLTSTGRKQILNRMAKRFDNEFEGNPDTQPTRSFEVHFMVVLLVFLSRVINDKVGAHIDRIYKSNSIFSKVVRKLVAPPITYSTTVKRGIQEAPERVIHQLPARINLRFLANKTTILCILSCFLLKRLFNFGILFLFSSVIIISFYSPSS